MAVHNGGSMLVDAVESILAQDFRDFELIVVDDGSTDATPDILSAVDDERLRMIRVDPCGGQTAALNRGLERANGRYIARQDADDSSLPARFERQVEYLESHPRVGVLGTHAVMVDSEERSRPFVPPCDDLELQRLLLLGNQFVHGSVMFRAECLRTVGAYDETYLLAQDYDLWLRMADTYQVANLPEVLYKYRVHDASLTTRHGEAMEAEAAEIVSSTLARRAGRPEGLTKIQREALARRRFRDALDDFGTGKVAMGCRRLCRSLDLDPELLRDEAFIGWQLPEAGTRWGSDLPRCQAAVRFLDSAVRPVGPEHRRVEVERRRLLATFLGGAAAEAYQNGHRSQARVYAARALSHGAGAIRNRGLWSLVLNPT
jgi:glycosyltransferase involved in cell wall biosynthesis